MKTICHVTSVHAYTDGRIFRKECQSLAKKNEVYLVAPNVEDQVLNGVNIRGVHLSKSRLKRMRSLDVVYQRMMEVNADVYHFHDPELIPIAYKAKKYGKKVIFDSHEDVPLQISEKAWIPWIIRKPLSTVYRKYEESRLRRFDALVTVTPSIVERLIKCNSNTYQITNYPIYKGIEDKRAWKNCVCFTGNISPQWMHENIIRSAKKAGVKYVLAGKTNEKYFEKLKAMPEWGIVDYKGVVSSEAVVQIQQDGIAGIALNDYVANVGYKLGSLGNTKLFEYMMAGIPVIATDFILWKEIVEKHECGICVNPRDTKAITSAIQYLKEHPDEAKRMGDNGIKAVKEHYNWESQETVLFNMYNKVLEQ